MAEAHPTPVPAADSTPVAGPQSDPVPNDVDVLKRELIDVRMTLECLKKTVENLTGVKVEAVSSLSSWFSALSPPPALDHLLMHTTSTPSTRGRCFLGSINSSYENRGQK